MSYTIILVGPSNAGKTRWTNLLKKAGYKTVSADELIEERLGPYLLQHGFRGIADVSRWMGQPYESRYRRNSELYLRYEREVMLEIIGRLESGEELVVDTTGSVIYTGGDIVRNLTLLGLVVSFGVPEHVQAEMLQRYFAEPKPVIWGDGVYKKKARESGPDSLKRCYPELLRTRLARYKDMAHFVLDYDLLRQPGFGVEDFITLTSL